MSDSAVLYLPNHVSKKQFCDFFLKIVDTPHEKQILGEYRHHNTKPEINFNLKSQKNNAWYTLFDDVMTLNIIANDPDLI